MADDTDVVGGTYGVRLPEGEAQSLIEQGFHMESDMMDTENRNDYNEKIEPEQNASETEVEEQQEVPETTEQPSEYEFNGEKYSTEDILSALGDAKNNSDWKAKNTQEAQRLSAEKKSLNAEIEKINELKGNEDLVNLLKDYLGEEHPFFEETSVAFDDADTQNTETEEQTTESEPVEENRDELLEEVRLMRAERELEKDIAQLQKDYPELDGDQEALKEVVDTAIEKMLPLADAYKIARFDSAETSAIKKAVDVFNKASTLKDIPDAKGRDDGDHTAPNMIPKDYDQARDYVLKNYDLLGNE